MQSDNPLYKKWNGKPVTKVMLWNIIDVKESPSKSYNSQKLVLIDQPTKTLYQLNDHKRHRSYNGYWYYLDTSESLIPKAKIRILETQNRKNGMVDYIYDPTWLPSLSPDNYLTDSHPTHNNISPDNYLTDFQPSHNNISTYNYVSDLTSNNDQAKHPNIDTLISHLQLIKSTSQHKSITDQLIEIDDVYYNWKLRILI